jgi:hypothetical protein
MAGIDVNSILSGVQQSSAVLDIFTKKNQDILDKAALVTGDSQSVLEQAAMDSATVASTKVAADLRTQAAKQALGIDFGTDRSAQNEVFSKLAATETAAWTAQVAARDIIEQKKSVGLLNNPLEFILNKLTIDKDINKYNAALRVRQDALDRIESLNQATSSSAILQNQFNNSVTVVSAEASTRLASVQAILQANQANIEGLKYNSQGIKEALEANAQKLAWNFSALGAKNAAANLALSQANSAREQARFEFSMQEKSKSDKYDSYIIDAVNAGRAIRGVPPLTGVKADNVLQTLKAKGPLAQEFMLDYQNGERFAESGVAKLASSPVDSAQLFSSGRAVSLSPAQELVKEKLGDAGVLAKLELAKNPDAKNPQVQADVFNKAANQILQRDATEIKVEDSKNIFSIAPINQIVKVSDAAAQTPVYQKILRPLLDNGVNLNDPNKVFAAVTEGLRTKKITYEEALSLTTIYHAGAAANLAQRDLPKFGLIPSFTYNVRLEIPGSLYGAKVMDITKPDVVGRYLNSYLALESLRKGRASE